MNTMKNICFILLFLALGIFGAQGRERVFADYFDIPTASSAGTAVTGRIHLERNKDVRTRPVPASYGFEALSASPFKLSTERDAAGRVYGVFRVAAGRELREGEYCVDVVLKDGKKELERFTVKIHVVPQTLWSTLYSRYAPETLKNPRLYGRKKPTDAQVAADIEELERGKGRFVGFKSYTAHPSEYPGQISKHDHSLGGTIEYDWEKVAVRLGGLGYAYATSDVYGPQGDAAKRERLRNALMLGLKEYMGSVSIEGDDVLVDGKPIGPYTGDGFSRLVDHKWAGVQISTHQWTLTDPLVVPCVYLMPYILEGEASGNARCVALKDAMLRYFQLFMSVIEPRRAIDDPQQRWGEIANPGQSSGAWADANIGHRSRTMMALPLLWADYNRPMTYVPYWYEDFYGGKPYEGFTFAHGWSPHGVMRDLAYWLSKTNVPTRRYGQSGFQPDGTISHHIGHGTDAAMVAYGFEWLTALNVGYNYLKGTPYEVSAATLQFELDRLLDVYPWLFYNGGMDYLVSGRSFLEDQSRFVENTYQKGVKSLLKAIGKRRDVMRKDSLRRVAAAIADGTDGRSGNKAYWVNEFMLHRRGGDKPFYASVKLKSERTVGAEDFDLRTRHSWHMGYGVMQLKIKGDEYSRPVLANYDWHALPGLTEEWRTDSLPLEGGSQASLPGANKIAGVLSDGTDGMAMYHHLPSEDYSSATARKSYHFMGDRIFAVGSGIRRLRSGQGAELATFMEQGALDSPLTVSGGGLDCVIAPGESRCVDLPVREMMYVHIGKRAYVLFPEGDVRLRILTGDSVNVTDRSLDVGPRRGSFILALMHVSNPAAGEYTYAVVPHATAKDKAVIIKEMSAVKVLRSPVGHAVKLPDGHLQAAFFEAGKMDVGGELISADRPAQLMLKSDTMAVGNPVPCDNAGELNLEMPCPLPSGTYPYTCGGIYPRAGRNVYVDGRAVRVELPAELLYSGTPIVVSKSSLQ